MDVTDQKTRRRGASALTGDDLRRFAAGTHDRLHQYLGAHMVRDGERQACRFAVWAPNARAVSVIGDFNGWNAAGEALTRQDDSGMWEGVIPDVRAEALYKYRITTTDGRRLDKADPFAFCAEPAPGNASTVCDLQFGWTDHAWMSRADR